MGDEIEEIIESQTEQEHQDAVDDSEQRTDEVNAAVEKLVTRIEDNTEHPSLGKHLDSEFEATLPMGSNQSDE